MIEDINIKTDRLRITNFSKKDINHIKLMLKDKSVTKNTGLREPQSDEQINNLVDRWLDRSNSSYYLSIIGKSGEYFGWIMLKHNNSNNYEFGYMLNKKYWNKGYMTEAAIASMNHFQIYNFEIYAKVDSTNLKSTKVLIKSGFKELQLEKDIITYKYYS